MSGLYAADGSINVSVVSAGSYSGLYHNDYSWNVIPSTTGFGYVDPPTGAIRVTLTAVPVNSIYAPDGSMYVSVSPYIGNTRHVTVVNGSFNTVTTPVLALISVVGNAVSLSIDVDNTVVAGDTVTLQGQATGGDWSVLVVNTTHTITAPEDAANEIDLTPTGFANGTYDFRAKAHHLSDSSWSNTVSATVAAGAANARISSAGNNRISSAGNFRKYA